MSYEPQPGYIGLTQIRGGVGKAIRFGQLLNGGSFSDYEHAFVYTGSGLIVEAEPGGAREVPIWYDLERVLWLRCPEQYQAGVVAAARTLVGTPYSFLDYGAIAAHRLHIPAPHLETFIRESEHLICSQLCDRAAMLGGWHLFDDNRWEGYVTPDDLRELADRQAV
jgi:cell wall-associated NlpC family hydrolase